MRTVLLAACLCLPSISMAQEPPANAPQSHESLFVNYRRMLRQLLRVEETESDGQGVWRKAVTMLARPAFHPESSVTLRERRGGDGPELVFATLDRNLWCSIPEDFKYPVAGEDGRELVKPDLDPGKVWARVWVRESRLDRARADRIYSLWERVLRDDHSPIHTHPNDIIEDGIGYDFRWRARGLNRRVENPEIGPASALAFVGLAMMDVCRCSGDERPKALKQLDDACAEVEKRLAAAQDPPQAGAPPAEPDPIGWRPVEGRQVDYPRKVRRLLRVEETESDGKDRWRKAVTMIERPAVDPESCVSLRERRGGDGPELILVAADRNIWKSIPEERRTGKVNEEEGIGDPHPKSERVFVRIREKSIDRARADRIYGLWDRVIRETRFPEGGSDAAVPNGPVHEFRRRSREMLMQLQVDAIPKGGPIEALVHLGRAMAEVCQKEGTPESLKRLDEACDELAKRLDAARP